LDLRSFQKETPFQMKVTLFKSKCYLSHACKQELNAYLQALPNNAERKIITQMIKENMARYTHRPAVPSQCAGVQSN
jgi:hypothetical protein